MPSARAGWLRNLGLGCATLALSWSLPAAAGVLADWGGNDWLATDEASSISAGDYVTFTVAVKSGFRASFASVSQFNYRHSASGPARGVLQYQVGAGSFVDAASLNYSSTSSTGASLSAIDLSSVAALQNVPGGTTVTFRIVNYGGTSSSGTWYVIDTANSTANDLEITGATAADATVVDSAAGAGARNGPHASRSRTVLSTSRSSFECTNYQQFYWA